MTLGDLLRQDGALALLAIGAALGFIAGAFFRVYAGKKEGCAPGSGANTLAAPKPGVIPAPSQAAVVAVITAAVNKYQNEDCI